MRLRLDSKQTTKVWLALPPGSEIEVPESVAADIVAQDAHFKPADGGDPPRRVTQTPAPDSTTETTRGEEPKVDEVPGEPTHDHTTERVTSEPSEATTVETVSTPPKRTKATGGRQ